MNDLLAAFSRAGRDLTRGEILWHAIWPPLVAGVLWAAIGIAVWAHGLAVMAELIPNLPWSGWEWVAHWAAVFLLLALFASLTWFTAVLLVAVVALPRLISLVATRDYPQVQRHGENAFFGSLANTLFAGVVFLAGWLASLPLLLIPGALLVLPMAWGAWLNQRTFRFDAIAEHATRAELKMVIGRASGRFYLAGIGCAALAHVPIVNLLVPTYTALVFVHFGLAQLRELRRRDGVQL